MTAGTTIKAVSAHGSQGLDGLRLIDLPDPDQPGPGEIRVRIHASSLNYHDFAVAAGHMGAPDGRIPMSDGAGVVEAIGAGVTELAVGDHVLSTFFPGWLDGEPTIADFSTTPRRRGRRLCARGSRGAPHQLHPFAGGLRSSGGGHADDGRADGLARAGREWQPEGRRQRAGAGDWRSLDLRTAIRQGDGRQRDRDLLVGREIGARARWAPITSSITSALKCGVRPFAH